MKWLIHQRVPSEYPSSRRDPIKKKLGPLDRVRIAARLGFMEMTFDGFN